MKIFNIRESGEKDNSFIINSWLKSIRETYPFTQICNDIFYSNHEKKIHQILEQSSTLVAVNCEDPDHIFGYIVYQQPAVIHYLYVKQPFRKLKIASSLIEASQILFPCVITALPKKARLAASEFIYNPYLIEKGELSEGFKNEVT